MNNNNNMPSSNNISNNTRANNTNQLNDIPINSNIPNLNPINNNTTQQFEQLTKQITELQNKLQNQMNQLNQIKSTSQNTTNLISSRNNTKFENMICLNNKTNKIQVTKIYQTFDAKLNILLTSNNEYFSIPFIINTTNVLNQQIQYTELPKNVLIFLPLRLYQFLYPTLLQLKNNKSPINLTFILSLKRKTNLRNHTFTNTRYRNGRNKFIYNRYRKLYG